MEVRYMLNAKDVSIRLLRILLIIVFVLSAVSAYADIIKDRTLVSWAAPATLDQRGGSVLTISQGDRFDGLVFAELAKGAWMLGSDHFRRTCRDQKKWPKECAVDRFVQIAATYRDSERRVTLYKDGVSFASYVLPKEVDTGFATDQLEVIIGIRHKGRKTSFVGKVKDVRVYDCVLSAEQIGALKPGQVGEIRPFAWWNFATGGAFELTGRYLPGTIDGCASIVDGALVLKGEGDSFISVPRERRWNGKTPVPEFVMDTARSLRECTMHDPHRPFYHFACIDGIAFPGDPNGAFYANGRYHLMYLYLAPEPYGRKKGRRSFRWGHIESTDLLHWRHLSDPIVPEGDDHGAFSGGAFVDDDGTAYLSYWMIWDALGLGIVRSTDARYEEWERHPANPVIPAVRGGEGRVKLADGTEKPVANADPSNIWKKNGRYYMLAGNKAILDRYGRKPDSPQEYKGDWLDLYVSDDLAKWEFVKVFYKRRANETRATGWTDEDEDNMCPVFLPLPDAPENGKDSGKWCMTFISHNRGCQYYIGTYDKKNDEFIPERHGRMTWVDQRYFAPEAMIDGKNRQLLWVWMLGDVRKAADRKGHGWYGVYALPRTLWLRKDGTLGIGVPSEFRNLRLGGTKETNVVVADGGKREMKVGRGDCCEISVKVPFTSASSALVKVRVTPDGEEAVHIWYDEAAKELVMDTTRMKDGFKPVVERAPFELAEGETLDLDVFVDRRVVEVFANGRQAISRFACPKSTEALGVVLSAKDGPATYGTVEVWELAPTNPY